jgi:putative nucleotidyltransferase with HDIG domain
VTTESPGTHFPHALAATATVTLAPAAAVWGLALGGVVTDFVPLLAVGLVVSLLVASGGRALWQRRPGSRDLLFSDLMLWGWLRRWHQERRLDDARALLGLDPRAVLARGELDPETRIKALKKLVTALEARDPYAHGHSRRVARYSAMIARKLGVPAAEVARIRLAARLHDVGNHVVPPTILNKPGKLSDDEFAVIRRHAPVGAEMVKGIGDDELTRIVAHHHERLDGNGYPSGLSGGEIPLGARIVAVADTFDALTSSRAYRPAKRRREVFRILGEEMGTQLDPGAVQAFFRCYSGFWGMAAWSVVTGAPQRVLLPLGSQAPAAGGTLTAKTLAGLSAIAATGRAVSRSSLTDPRDSSANWIGGLAIAAVGASGHSVEVPVPAIGSAGLRDRRHGETRNRSNGHPRSGVRELRELLRPREQARQLAAQIRDPRGPLG